MITVTFKFEDRYGPMDSFTCDMPCVPRVGERVNAYGTVSGVVQLVTWQIEDEGITALIAVRV